MLEVVEQDALQQHGLVLLHGLQDVLPAGGRVEDCTGGSTRLTQRPQRCCADRFLNVGDNSPMVMQNPHQKVRRADVLEEAEEPEGTGRMASEAEVDASLWRIAAHPENVKSNH